METTYNQFAGKNLGRLEALSDGIFAFAMTLLALDIHVPDAGPVHSERDLLRALLGLMPLVLPWILSFMTLGIFWVGQQTQLGQLKRTDRHYTWISLAFLASVTAIPFSTRLLIQFAGYRLALLIYWFNILLLGLLILACWLYACRARLMKPEVTEAVSRAVIQRVVRAQLLYAFGAALCLIHNNWSIGFILLVQINYALAPRFLAKWTA
ncbi:MAG TPA: TMEM175 family protein [bacterium]|nr:TMEM175 family protein [bacterium]